MDSKDVISRIGSSNNYLNLRADRATLLDLFRVLLFRDIDSGKLGFIDGVFELRTTTFKRRLLIFTSISFQKVLQCISKPFACLGSTFECWLNLLLHNKSFCTMLFRALQGTLEIPDKESSSYVSIVGYLDKRVDLGKFKPGDSKYFEELCAMASKVAYENKAFIENVVQKSWQMNLIGAKDFWNEYQQNLSTQGFMFHDMSTDPDTIVVAFRGTEPFRAEDWCTDIDLSWHKLHPGKGKVHRGFAKALGLQENNNEDQPWQTEIEQDDPEKPLAYYFIRDKLRQLLTQNSRTRFVVTGHSLGGALAVLFAAVLALHEEEFLLQRLEAVYTFGQPRVGDREFGEFMKGQLRNYDIRYYRFVYSHDIVPRIPFDDSTMLFKHFGTCLYYDSLFQGQALDEEPFKNYCSLKAFVAKRVDALWEIVRSFLLPHIYGAEYKEGWVLRAVRLSGLLVPGLPAHCPNEYINSIRLGEEAHA